MAEYDPKRRRARPAADANEPAPVDALLDGGVESRPRRGVAAASYGAATPSSTINLADEPQPEPPAPEPEPETETTPEWVREYESSESGGPDVRKAVMAGIVGLLLVLLILWARRRRS